MNKLFSGCGFLFAAFMFLFGCTYEEGPLISLRSKTARLSQEWNLVDVQIDGISNGNYVWEIEFERDGVFIESFKLVYDQGDFTRLGTWEFIEGKEHVLMTFEDGTTRDMAIKKLTSDELKVDFLVEGEEGLQKWEIIFQAAN